MIIHVLMCKYFQVAAVQVSPSQLSVEMFPSGTVNDLKTDVHIKGVYVTKVIDLSIVRQKTIV